MIVAIDGPAGSGKSSTAKLLAARLGFQYLDTGAMYRAVTLKCLRAGISAGDGEAIRSVLEGTVIDFTGTPPDVRVWLDGEDVSDAVRGDEVTKNVSDYCTPAAVREAMVSQQRRIAAGKDVVCEGRDIGTVVFPRAAVKIFMTAGAEERARRRRKDFEALGVHKELGELVEEIRARDHKDSTRRLSPLHRADDAEEMDTTGMTLEDQVDYIVEKVRKKTLNAQ